MFCCRVFRLTGSTDADRNQLRNAFLSDCAQGPLCAMVARVIFLPFQLSFTWVRLKFRFVVVFRRANFVSFPAKHWDIISKQLGTFLCEGKSVFQLLQLSLHLDIISEGPCSGTIL